MFHVRCPNCGAEGWSDGSNPDAAVRCTSPAGDPPGSTEGSCSTLGHTHAEHIAHVLATGDASSRPVIITAYAQLGGQVMLWQCLTRL
jgi:hypothetical protein